MGYSQLCKFKRNRWRLKVNDLSESVNELYEVIIFDNDDIGSEAVIHILQECFPTYSEQLCRKIVNEAGGKDNKKHHSTCYTGTLTECQKHCEYICKNMPAKVCKVI